MLALVIGIGITAYSQTVTIKCTELRQKIYDEVNEEWTDWAGWASAKRITIQISKVVDEKYTVSILENEEVLTLLVIADYDDSANYEHLYIYNDDEDGDYQIWTGNVSLESLVKGISVWNPDIHSLYFWNFSGGVALEFR